MSAAAKALLAGALLALLACSGAAALKTEFGDLVISATVKVEPRALPAKRLAPVELTTVTRVASKKGGVPPALKRLRFQFDRFASIRTKGVPVCTVKRLEETTPAVARRRCKGALVGTGIGRARVQLPGEPVRNVSSPLSLFNGPRKGGRATLIAHAYETVPAAKTLLVALVIEPVKRGRYGFQVEAELPEIAAGHGAATTAKATLGRTYRRGGKRFGYLNARCVGDRLQVYSTALFANGDFFPATLTSTCRAVG